VAAGTDLSRIDLEFVSYPRHQIPEGAITDPTLLSGYESSVPLPAQLPIFSANIRQIGSVSLNAVEEKIPPGMRAMTIKVDATTAVEGWAAPGSVVDVLLVQEDKTTVIAERVKILSAERSVEELQEGGPRVPSTVTVLVTQEQCLAINTAIPLGRIAFALRSSQDEDSWNSRTFTAANLNKTKKEASVSGFVSVRGEGGSRSYALADGKWIVADSKPDGFLVSEER
jgi:pilus assembly protein CpaB